VRIIRRHHPLEGIELDVVRGGRSELLVRHPDSLTMRIPRAWTNADAASPAPRAETDIQLTVEALRELIHLVDVLGDRD
jgi:hypothetical protein